MNLMLTHTFTFYYDFLQLLAMFYFIYLCYVRSYFIVILFIVLLSHCNIKIKVHICELWPST